MILIFLIILPQIDHSIIESFGGKGKTCITARVYPKLAIDTAVHLYTFNYGNHTLKISSLSAWSMKNAKMVQGAGIYNVII